MPRDRTPEQARLVDLLARSTSVIGDALAEAERAHEELAQLVVVIQDRPLDQGERARFGALERAERAAANRFTAARHWRDAITGRIRELRLRESEARGPAA
jgi:hypothetical protein